MSTIELKVSGMSCGSCVNHIKQALQPLTGVEQVDVDLRGGTVKVSGPVEGGADKIAAVLAEEGYPSQKV